jgi:hypothetical protein
MQRHAPWLRLSRVALGSLMVVLAGCASDAVYHLPGSQPQRQPVPSPESPARPVITPAVPATPSPGTPSVPAPTRKTHPRYAPPPHLDAHWDNRLGVYVISGQSLYYRERLYYRWSNGWYCAGQPGGPWEAVDEPSVPTGLRGLH